MKGQPEVIRRRRGLNLAAIGLEAEFTMLLDGEPAKPEDVFGSPTAFVRQRMMHRVGRSYHLPTGGAIYFDTGVIEVATPLIEIARGCSARAGRSLWESIDFVRKELDAWEGATHHNVHLTGFSAHYNVSFDIPASERRRGRSVEDLALLLAHILPIPVMLLGANRRSTGIGVRPRGNRVEITADFTPDPARMIATATLIVGIVRAVMSWRRFTLSQLDEHEIPVVRGFAPVPHSSRKGWVARYSCFPSNPFQCEIDDAMWATRDGRRESLRLLGAHIARTFWSSIRRLADPYSLRLIAAVLSGRATSLLELSDRPAAYDDVGRLTRWGGLFSERALTRSRYERVLLHATSGDRLRAGTERYVPVGMRGWSHVVLRRERDNARRVWSLDKVLARADAWERTPRRSRPSAPRAHPAIPVRPSEVEKPIILDTGGAETILPATSPASRSIDAEVVERLRPVREPEVSGPTEVPSPTPRRRPRREPNAEP